jgi:hypothetical protein
MEPGSRPFVWTKTADEILDTVQHTSGLADRRDGRMVGTQGDADRPDGDVRDA